MRGLSVGVWTFGMGSDRYVGNGYKPYLPLEERIKRVAALQGADGVEVTFPNDVNEDTVEAFSQMLDHYGLELAGMGVELVCDGEWQSGSFTSPDQGRRELSLELTKRAMDLAEKLNVSTVSLWLGQDGFDYAFQEDYSFAWRSLIHNLRLAAEYNPKVGLGLEYKTSEPKLGTYINSGGKALALAYATGQKNVGITLDVGHAFNARENPAEIAAVLLDEHRLFHLHLNDNYSWADDDMPVGTVHFLQYLELFYWLDKMNYDGWLSLDLYPYRDDPMVACQTSIDFIQRMRSIVAKVEFDEMVAANQYQGSKVVKAIYDHLFNR